LALVRERAMRHRISLTLRCGPDTDDWVADERKVRQAVLNLVSNAVKLTPEGGSVELRAERGERCLTIAVSDTGTGIAPDHLEVIFDEFRQVGLDQTRRAEGTGLGLALTRRFVELQGGSVSVE